MLLICFMPVFTYWTGFGKFSSFKISFHMIFSSSQSESLIHIMQFSSLNKPNFVEWGDDNPY